MSSYIVHQQIVINPLKLKNIETMHNLDRNYFICFYIHNLYTDLNTWRSLIEWQKKTSDLCSTWFCLFSLFDFCCRFFFCITKLQCSLLWEFFFSRQSLSFKTHESEKEKKTEQCGLRLDWICVWETRTWTDIFLSVIISSQQSQSVPNLWSGVDTVYH